MCIQCTGTYSGGRLVCLDNVFSTLKFHNFVPKHSLSLKLLQLVHNTMGNVMQFTELINIAYTYGEIVIMLGHI